RKRGRSPRKPQSKAVGQPRVDTETIRGADLLVASGVAHLTGDGDDTEALRCARPHVLVVRTCLSVVTIEAAPRTGVEPAAFVAGRQLRSAIERHNRPWCDPLNIQR